MVASVRLRGAVGFSNVDAVRTYVFYEEVREMKTMNADEKQKFRIRLAKNVISAQKAYHEAMRTAEAFGLDCRNTQHIVYVDGRGLVKTVLINGGETP